VAFLVLFSQNSRFYIESGYGHFLKNFLPLSFNSQPTLVLISYGLWTTFKIKCRQTKNKELIMFSSLRIYKYWNTREEIWGDSNILFHFLRTGGALRKSTHALFQGYVERLIDDNYLVRGMRW
jgi:hypothetical protein